MYKTITRLLVPFALASPATLLQAAEPVSQKKLVESANNGREFLVELVDSDLNLLPEFQGHHVYWLFHDNYLAAKTLDSSHPQIAKSIRQAVDGFEVHSSGKIEILFGETNEPLPFRHHHLFEVTRIGHKTIRTEKTKPETLRDWEKYTDLLFLAAIANSESNLDQAKRHFRHGTQSWDGVGFADAVVEKANRYATYKLALAILAANRLEAAGEEVHLPTEATSKLLALQHKSGGWITDYLRDGKAIGKANVETTCLAVLALDSIMAQKKSPKGN